MRLAKRTKVSKEFLLAQSRRPIQAQRKRVIEFVENTRAPGRQTKNRRSAQAVVRDEEWAAFSERCFRNGRLDVGHGNSGKRTQPFLGQVERKQRWHGGKQRVTEGARDLGADIRTSAAGGEEQSIAARRRAAGEFKLEARRALAHSVHTFSRKQPRTGRLCRAHQTIDDCLRRVGDRKHSAVL